ncbi:CBM96 family carbohydrate-binding protein [Paenibacillus sp. SAF-068]|uniref:CBM96 family carbohydrate-binding protein n=1 Tax=Paenibacillus sp. SAF-068 TaxID=3436864 RepID=UPI003F7D5897
MSGINNGETLLDSVIHIKSPENRFAAKYILYNQVDEELSSTLMAATRKLSEIVSSVSVRVRRSQELSNSLYVMYKSQGDLSATIQAASKVDLEGMLYVRPHNRAHGKYELLEAPRVTVNLKPVADATTRSQTHLQTLNFGDTQRMMIGRDEIEQFESFVHFGDLDNRIPDLLYMEEVKLRLYYTGTLAPEAHIELHQPDTLWREYGITHANRPQSIQLLSSSYIINNAERYIEFDMMALLQMWREGILSNVGMIIQSSGNTPIYFNTRESSKPPVLQIKYITSQIYSIGRTEIGSDIFIYGAGRKDIASTLVVHSDIGLDWLKSQLYVHRYEDHMHHDIPQVIAVSRPDLDADLTVAKRIDADLDSNISIAESRTEERETWVVVSKPELHSQFITAIRTTEDLDSNLAVRVGLDDEKTVQIAVSHPDLPSVITVDRQMSLVSTLTISQLFHDGRDTSLMVSIPDLHASVEVSNYTKATSTLGSLLKVMYDDDSTVLSEIMVNKPDLNSVLQVRALDHDERAASLEIPYLEEQPGQVCISRPDVHSSIEIKYMDVLDGHISIKEREYLDGYLQVREWKDMQSKVDVRQIVDMATEMIISKPDLAAYVLPRVIANEELDSITSIRKRDASDLVTTVIVKSPGNQAYFYIL